MFPSLEAKLQRYETLEKLLLDPDVLADCAADVGMDRDEALRFLESDEGREEVNVELVEGHQNGITAVPTYVVNGQWAIPGAQEPETFAKVLTRMASKLSADAAADADG